MEQQKRIIYTPNVENSMLELLEDDFNFDAPSVLSVNSSEIAMGHFNAMEYPKRDFWELAKKYSD